jgi:ankyrin repeat protein
MFALGACGAASPAPPAPPPPIVAHAPAPPPAAPDRDSEGWTPLQRAAEAGNVAEIDRLIHAGADLEATSPQVYSGATALLIALQFSEPEAAQLLLDRGASIAGAIGTEALELAARDGEDAIVGELLARKVSPLGTDALPLAARYGRTTTIGKLVAAGALVNDARHADHEYTPLIYACIEGRVDAARELLRAGAHIDARDDAGATPLHWAVFAARPSEVHIYRSLDQPHDTRFIPKPDAPLVALLIARHAALDATDAEGNTPLHDAAMFDAKAAAQLLVRAGANLRARNREGKTPFDLAHDRHNSVETVVRIR